MAASKFTTWVYVQMLSEKLSLISRYDVYADMNDGNVQPYIRLNDCQLYGYSRSYLSARVSATVKIQSKGTGTAYSFNTGSYIKERGTDYLDVPIGFEGGGPMNCVSFSSSTNVPIKKNGELFNFNVTVTTRNNEKYTLVQPACGTVSQKINGPATINTGAIAKYTFGTALTQDDNRYTATWIRYNLCNQNPYNQYPRYYEGYVSDYKPIDYETGSISSVSFVPIKESYDNLSSASGKVFVQYYRHIPKRYVYSPYTDYIVAWSENVGDNSSYDNTNGLYRERKAGICLSAVSKAVTVKSRSTVDAVLKPTFKNLEYFVYPPENTRGIQRWTNYYQDMITKYGGIVQGSRGGRVSAYFYADERHLIRHRGVSGPRLKYGDQFRSGSFSENLSGTMRTYNNLYDYRDYAKLDEIHAEWTFTDFNTSGKNRTIKFSLIDDFGFTTDVSDTLTILPYSKPTMPVCRAQRCSILTSDPGADQEVYTYEGVSYKLDNVGEYAVIEWQISVSSLDNKNSRALRARLSTGGAANITYGAWRTIAINSYTASGYFVVRVDPEKSYNVQFELSDDFYANEYFITPINTAYALIDFKKGGTGVAMGKVSELDYVYDIHRNWTLNMPYDTMIQNYNSNGSFIWIGRDRIVKMG